MNWTLAIEEIIQSGLTAQQISASTGIKRTTIVALRTGQNQDPSWSRGDRLISLLRDKCPDSELLPENKVTS